MGARDFFRSNNRRGVGLGHVGLNLPAWSASGWWRWPPMNRPALVMLALLLLAAPGGLL